MNRFIGRDTRTKPLGWPIWTLILTALAAGMIAGCDQNRPAEVNAPAAPTDPEVVVDKFAKTVTVTDPTSPNTPLVIRIDESNGTQTYEYGDLTLVSGRGYITAYTGRDVYEVSWEEVSDTRYVERYYVNGAVLSLEIDGLATGDQVQEFVDFYSAHDTGLGNHPDVLAMADILRRSQPQFVRIIEGAGGEVAASRASIFPGDARELGMAKWMRIGCGAAAICASIACKLTALTHPACWICAGISLGCMMAMAFS